MVSNDSDLNQFRQVSNARYGKGKTPISEHLYDVGPDFVFPDLTEVDGATSTGPETQQLTTVYYDTPDARLAQRGVTLRRRQGGTEPGWQLSLAAANGAREVRAPLGKTGAPVPARLARLVSGHTRGRDLVPVAELEVARTVYRLRGQRAGAGPGGRRCDHRSPGRTAGHDLDGAFLAAARGRTRHRFTDSRTVGGGMSAVGGCTGLDGEPWLSVGGRRRGTAHPEAAGEVFAGYLRRQVDAALT